MKCIQSLFFCTFLLVTIQLQAQVPEPKIVASEAAMSQGVNKCVIVELVDIEAKDAEKLWRDFAKKSLDEKPKKIRKTDEYLADGASIPGISGKQNVYATFKSRGNDTEMRLWVDNGNDFVNPEDYPSDYGSVRNTVISFNRAIERDRVQDELSAEEDMLKDHEKDLKKLDKEKDRLEDDIQKYEKKIQEAKDRIAEIEKEQEAKTAEVKIQEKVVDEVKDRLGNIKN